MSNQQFDDLLPSILRGEIQKESTEKEKPILIRDIHGEAGIHKTQSGKPVKNNSEVSEPSKKTETKNKIAEKSSDKQSQKELLEKQHDNKIPLFGCPIEEDRKKSGWGVLGRVSGQVVRIDLQYPKLMAIFGQIRSGKSYLAGVLTEMSAKEFMGINKFPGSESAVIIFNYRKSREARFEYWTFVHKNQSLGEVKTLRDVYGASTDALKVENFQVCAYSRELSQRQNTEYAGMRSLPLLFKSKDLEDDDWMLLMGLPDPDRIYVQVMRNIVEDLGYNDALSLDNLRIEVENSTKLSESQKAIASLRLDFANRYIDDSEGLNWDEIIRPGTVTVIDLRRRQGRADDALRLSLVVLSAIRNLDRNFHKFVLFDEFHEYYNSKFSESLDNVARMVGHQNWTLCLATQNTHKVDPNLLRLFTNKFVFQVDSTTWKDLSTADERLKAIAYSEISSLQRERGECYALLDECTDSRYGGVPIKLNVRPRATKHGGTTAGQD